MGCLGKPAQELAERIELWKLESDYIAQAVTNYVLTISPQKVILGGGAMHQKQMFPLVRKKVLEKLNSYMQNDVILKYVEEYCTTFPQRQCRD